MAAHALFFFAKKGRGHLSYRLGEENAAAFDAALKREKLIRCYQLLNYLTSLYYTICSNPASCN